MSRGVAVPGTSAASLPARMATHSFFPPLPSYLQSFGLEDGAGLAAAVVLIVLLALVLPRNDRKKLRGPVLLLALHLLLLGTRGLFGGDTQVGHYAGLAALFVLLLGLGRSAFLLATRWLTRRGGVPPKIFLDIVQGLIFGAALLLVLHVAGVDPGSLVTGSAVLTIILGLSLRDTLGNLFAGLAIQAQRPFEVGDWIQFDQHAHHIGQVIEINWRATTVVTLDAVEIIVPNAKLGDGYIVNFSRPRKYSRRSVYVNAPYEFPPQRVHRIILDVVAGSWGVADDPPPSVVTQDFEDSGVRYWVRFFTYEFGQRDRVDGGVRDRIWYAFRRHGIPIPFPVRTVELHQASAEAEAHEEAAQVEEQKQALRCVDFLAGLGDKALDRLARLVRPRLYAANEVIIRQGDHGDELFILQDGEVAVTLETPGEPPHEVARLGPRSFFGEMSLLTGEPRSATVRAAKECHLLAVGKSAFAQVLEASPELAELVSQTIAGRQAGLTVAQEARDQRDGTEVVTVNNRLLKRIKEFFSI